MQAKSEEWLRWAAWLAAGVAIWLGGGILVSMYLDKWTGAPGFRECAASCVYIALLLIVMAIGNFARVRALLVLEIVYGAGVLVRAVVGTAYALMFLDEQGSVWLGGLSVLVRPLRGLEYIAMQLTAHFVTEIYWLGLGLSATILVFLACVAHMSASSRIARARERARRRAASSSPAARREPMAGRRGK